MLNLLGHYHRLQKKPAKRFSFYSQHLSFQYSRFSFCHPSPSRKIVLNFSAFHTTFIVSRLKLLAIFPFNCFSFHIFRFSTEFQTLRTLFSVLNTSHSTTHFRKHIQFHGVSRLAPNMIVRFCSFNISCRMFAIGLVTARVTAEIAQLGER
jgi:hypothetical protein